jgi:predicted HTH transcriptional regulator
MKMFNMIGIGERAGSGVPDIFAVWESQGWKAPEVEEQYNPDRTILTLSFEKQAIKTGDKNRRQKQAIESPSQGPTQDGNEVLHIINHRLGGQSLRAGSDPLIRK